VSCLLNSKTLAPEECFLVGLATQEVLEKVSSIQGATWLQYEVPVVQSSFQIEDSFLGKSGGKHVLAVDLAPEVPIVLSIIPHLTWNWSQFIIIGIISTKWPKMAAKFVPSMVSMPTISL